MPTDAGVFPKSLAEHGSEKYILELQPAERGLQSQILEADLVLWTVGSKPPLSQLEPYDKTHELPLNGRGQAETDETLRVKGHPRIFALGDSSALRDMNGRILPATAQVLYYFNFLDVGRKCSLFHFFNMNISTPPTPIH
jgi:NADH:ubiquinone reductase (non-electrogenic)